MAKAGAQIEISASSSRLATGLSQAYGRFMAFGRDVGRGLGRAFKAINAKLAPGDTAKRALGNFGGDMLGRGMDAIFDAAGEVRQFESEMQRLGVTTQKTPAQMLELRNALMQVSAATGINREQLVAASALYFDLTSDADGMSKSIGALARVSQASGAGMEELVKTSAAMKDSMNIGPEQMEAMFSGLIAQGEAGKVTLRELAREAPALMAMFSKFNTGAAGVMQMNAAFQVGAKAFGSASQAATGLEAMMGMLQARSSKLKSIGINVFQKDGRTLRNLQDIVASIAKVNPKQSSWGKIFGENKEGRAFLEMLMKYPELYKEIVAAGSNAGLVQEYANSRAESAAGRLDIALNKMKLTIAEAFTPERIEGFVRAVEGLADKLGPIVDGVGFVADKLGGLTGVGKSIRGFFSSANPWEQNNDIIRDSLVAQSKGYVLGADNSPEKMAGRLKAAQLRIANRDAFASASSSIIGAEVNDRTSAASLRRAMFAAMSDRSQAGGLGAQTAGSLYLKNAGSSLDKEREKFGAEQLKVMEDGLAKIATAIAASQPQIGDNQVARSTTKATAPRRGAQ